MGGDMMTSWYTRKETGKIERRKWGQDVWKKENLTDVPFTLKSQCIEVVALSWNIQESLESQQL